MTVTNTSSIIFGPQSLRHSETAKSVDQVKLNRTANTELWVHIVSDSFCPGWDYTRMVQSLKSL